MPKDKSFFAHYVYFFSKNTDWAKNYLKNRNYRITDMLSPSMDDFFKNYGQELVNCFEKKQLLLRAKIYNKHQNNICLFQIWRNRVCQQSFQNKFDIQFKKAIKNLLVLKKFSRSASKRELNQEIEALRLKPVIWQFVGTEFKKFWMTIGDPLK